MGRKHTTRVGNALKRIVDGKHDGLHPNFSHGAHQGRRREMSRSRDEELLPKIITNKLVLAHRHVRKSTAVKLVVNTINIIRAAAALALDYVKDKRSHWTYMCSPICPKISFTLGNRSKMPLVTIPRICMFSRSAYPKAEKSSHGRPSHISLWISLLEGRGCM